MNLIIGWACLFSALNISYESGSGYYAQRYVERYAHRAFRTCMFVGERATSAHLNPLEVISISRVETGHRFGLVSKAGARGPLQVLPKYYPLSKGDRDWIDPALRLYRYLRRHKRYGQSFQHTAGRYNGSGYRGSYARAAQRHLNYLSLITLNLIK